MITVEIVHSRYLIIKDGSFPLLYVNVDENGDITLNTEPEGITPQQMLAAIAALQAHMGLKP
jgi:uncharacterized protein (DUF2141 family)